MRQLPLPGMEHLRRGRQLDLPPGASLVGSPASRHEHFHQARQIAGQGVMTYGEPRRFRGRETDPRNPHFNDEPSAHVEGHGFIRDNTSTNVKAYDMREDKELWQWHAVKREVHPAHPLHTLQTERETARPSQRPPGSGAEHPRVMRIRGKDVIVDGHHRLAAARAAGRPITVEHIDMDRKLFGNMTHAEMLGL